MQVPIVKTRLVKLLIILGLGLWTFPSSLSAQDSEEPSYQRFDFSPLVGYRTSVSFPIEPSVSGTNPRVVLNAAPSYGFSFGYRVHEDDLVEFRWARQDSKSQLEGSNIASTQQNSVLNQFHGDFSHEYVIEEWAHWARPFVMASVGATHVSNALSSSFTRFSFGIGGGLRFYASKHVGFKIQAEWLPIFVNPYATVICGSGCLVHVGGTLSSQGEVIGGPLFRF